MPSTSTRQTKAWRMHFRLGVPCLTNFSISWKKKRMLIVDIQVAEGLLRSLSSGEVHITYRLGACNKMVSKCPHDSDSILLQQQKTLERHFYEKEALLSWASIATCQGTGAHCYYTQFWFLQTMLSTCHNVSTVMDLFLRQTTVSVQTMTVDCLPLKPTLHPKGSSASCMVRSQHR